MYEQEDTSWSFAIGLFIGAVAGAALASLFTPRNGAQNRELVLETGLVLKDRVTDATSSVATSVKETTSSAVSTVKDTTSSAVTTVKDTTTSAVSTVKDTTTSAVATVKDAASSAVEKVSDVTSTTVATVKDAASSAVEKVSDVTSTAADKARELTGRTQAPTTNLPGTTDLVSEASYDAEDVRPVTTTTPTSTIVSTPSVGLTPTTIEEETTYANPTPSTGTSQVVGEAVSELVSPEQFEVTDTGTSGMTTTTRTVAGTDADVREASEGADRSG